MGEGDVINSPSSVPPTADVDKIINEAYGSALACQERAYFFASKEPAVKISASAKLTDPADADLRFRSITDAYAKAGALLIERLTDVSLIYFPLQETLLRWRILKADREKAFVIESRQLVINRYNKIIEQLESRVCPSAKTAASELDVYCRAWKGADNICRLLMEEITFLCERVDECQSSLNSLWGLAAAIIAIGLSALVSIGCEYKAHQDTLLSIQKAHEDFLAALPKASDETPAQAIHSEMTTLVSETGHLKLIENKLDAIKADTSGSLAELHEPNTPNEKEIWQRLDLLSTNLRDLQAAINSDASSKGDLWLKLDALSQKVQNLDSSVKALPGTPNDIPAISSALKKIHDSLKELRSTVAKKQVQEIKQDNRSIINFGH